jgi:hypothetical protein
MSGAIPAHPLHAFIACRDWMLFSSCGLNFWVALLCYTLSISSLNLFMLYLCLSHTHTPSQQQSSSAVLPFPLLPTIFSYRHWPLYPADEDRGCLCNIGTYVAEKTVFYTRAHTHSRQYIGRDSTQRNRGYNCILHCSPYFTKLTYLSK